MTIHKVPTLKIGTFWIPSPVPFCIGKWSFLYSVHAFGMTPPPSERKHFMDAPRVCTLCHLIKREEAGAQIPKFLNTLYEGCEGSQRRH